MAQTPTQPRRAPDSSPPEPAAEPNLARLRRFIRDFGQLVASTGEEASILEAGRTLLADLVAHDDWLPTALAEPDPERYRQYLLHCDSQERFSIVSFVWGPGQATPVHNHTVWGLIGVLRGAETSQAYRLAGGGLAADGPVHRLEPGQVEAVSPTIGDVHQVANAYADRTSISIHVYGGNIGAVRRATFGADGVARPFISGYSNATLPNVWDASREPHA